jgi:hypothetical protein
VNFAALILFGGFERIEEKEKFVKGRKDIAGSVVWVRRDLPGHEACRVLRLDAGWQVAGVAVLAYEKGACRLDYVIDCDPRWVTRSAVVRGWIGDRTIDVTVVRDAAGQWQLNGRTCEDVAGCVDIDLNFSPSTNLLPIRRLDPAVGASAMVRAAWLRFPSFVLEPLEQSYTRLDHRRYRYESAGGRFVADLKVDETGLVIDYGEIWTREAAA